MACKFHAAAMQTHLTTALRHAACVLALAAPWLPAQAEKADRGKPMVVEADRPGTVDLQRQVVVFNGNVTITQGTMVIRAERVELREMPDGYRAATAIGSSAQPASYRQKRDGVDETVEGEAERIEYDGRADRLRFVGHGAVRRLRGTVLADEITGNAITWDANAELFSVEGGAPTAANPSGRVRAVLSPPPSASAAPAASAPLQPSRNLGGR
jgi:lipopolysaccharide export system protein LptA